MTKRMWEVRQAAETGVLDIYLYGDVEAGHYEGWYDDWRESENSANAFRKMLSDNRNVSQINLYINSYGGSVFEGTAIYSLLRRHPAHKTVYIDGFACSIASVIAMAGDEIIMPRNTLMMIHNMWMIAIGNAEELRKAADDLDVINDAGRAAYLEKAGDKLSEEELIRMMNVETWLDAERCLELGLCDKIDERNADMTNAAEVLQRAAESLTQRAETTWKIAERIREITQKDREPLQEDEEKEPKQESEETRETRDEATKEQEQQQEQPTESLFNRFFNVNK